MLLYHIKVQSFRINNRWKSLIHVKILLSTNTQSSQQHRITTKHIPSLSYIYTFNLWNHFTFHLFLISPVWYKSLYRQENTNSKQTLRRNQYIRTFCTANNRNSVLDCFKVYLCGFGIVKFSCRLCAVVDLFKGFCATN